MKARSKSAAKFPSKSVAKFVVNLAAVIVMLLFVLAAIGAAQTAARPPAKKPAVLSKQQAAELAARKQFAAALAEYQKHPDDASLRDQVIQLAKGLKTAPAVPAAAKADFAQATAQFKAAAAADDFKNAATLFEQAAAKAPWFGDPYYNAAVAWAKAADLERAKSNLVVYLAAAREGANTQDAQQLIKEIGRQQNMQQFQQAVAALKQNPADSALREKIMRQAAELNPPPPLPEDTQRFLARGKVAMSEAKQTADFNDAAQQFGHAIDAAPWYGPAYYNLAVAQNAAADFAAARQNLNLYLAWARDPADIQTTKDLIYQLEYKQEKAGREQAARDAEAQRQAQEQQAEAQRQAQMRYRLNEGLSGNWHGQQGCSGANVSVNGAGFSATLYCGVGDNMRGSGNVSLQGSKQDLQLSGSATFPAGTMVSTLCGTPSTTSQFDGYVSEDGSSITLRLNYPSFYAESVGMGIFKRCNNGSVRVDHWTPITVIVVH